MHEVQQLSGGTRHAAVFTGKSLPPASPPPRSAPPADLIYQVHLECRKSERIVSQPTPYLRRALPRHSLGPSESGGEAGREKASLPANIGSRVKGGRPVYITSDPSAGPRGLAKTDEEG